MKLSTHKLLTGILLPALLLGLLFSCEKKTADEEFVPKRMFTPGDVKATNGETEVRLEWRASLFTETIAEEYTVQVSKDSLFAGTIDHSLVTDTNSVSISDAVLAIKQKYFARVKANATTGSEESHWVYSNSFAITGEQIFLAINDAELKDKSVILRWRATPGITKIVLKPQSGAATDITLTPAEVTARAKTITGLTAETDYTAEIYAGTLIKGTIAFKTKVPSLYTVTLSPGDDLLAAVNAAENNDVIGLNPGTYDIKDGAGVYAILPILQKTITIASVSGNPANTKVNYREITLKGTGAGITLRGIEFDGAPATTAGTQALYFLNLTGPTSDGGASVFTDILVDNCIVHDMGNDFLRGNRAANNDHKINSIKVKNSRVYNSSMINNNYTFFQINKLEFTTLELSNSTLYNIGRGLIDWDANITFPVGCNILIDQCTINNFGRAGLDNSLIDLNGNAISVMIRNSIIGNAPYTGETVGNNLVRVTNATVTVSHTNTFKLNNGSPTTPLALTFPGTVGQVNPKTIDLGWTAATTDFTLPAGHELRTAGTTGGAIGDPRWAQ